MRRAGPLLLAALAAAVACGSPTYVFRSDVAKDPGVPPGLGPRSARILHFGDFGDDTRQQSVTADGLVAAHRKAPFDLAISAGDNVYGCGPDPTLPGAADCRFDDTENAVVPGYAPPPDPLYAKRHDRPLARLAAPPALPIYLALGNHDVAAGGRCRVGGFRSQTLARRRACLEVARETPLWRMPGRHYVVDHGRARLIVVDSNLVKGDYGGFSFDDEVAFVAEASRGCEARACFLVGHHPPVTAGSHAGEATPSYLGRMDRLIAAGGGRIRGWLAGHDHDLQHLRTPGGLDVLVSGNMARGRRRERFEETSVRGAELVFASVRWGHGVLEVFDDGWSYRFESSEGAGLYCCIARGASPCAPVRCGR